MKKQSGTFGSNTNVQVADINMDDGKSSEEFLRKLKEISSPSKIPVPTYEAYSSSYIWCYLAHSGTPSKMATTTLRPQLTNLSKTSHSTPLITEHTKKSTPTGRENTASQCRSSTAQG